MRSSSRLLALAALALVAACGESSSPKAGQYARKPGTTDLTPAGGSTDANGDDAETPSSSGPTPSAPGDIDNFIKAELTASKITGASIAWRRRGAKPEARVYGLAEISPQRKVTKNTLDPIDKAAGFQVRNPAHADKPITFRMLLTHTSSLVRDVAANYEDKVLTDDNIASMRSGEYVRRMLAEGNQFLPNEPGKLAQYSNFGITLLGHAVEAISGQPFERYCDEKILRPLRMERTYMRAASSNDEDFAMPYKRESAGLEAGGLWSHPIYPAGEMLSTPSDLLRLSHALAAGGELDGARILRRATVDEMLRDHYKGQLEIAEGSEVQGLVLYQEAIGNEALFGHAGAIYGSTADVRFRTTSGSGVAVLVNAASDDGALEAIERIEAKILELLP